MKLITLPERAELLARLTAVDDNPHLVERFYPLLLKTAGEKMYGNGIALALILANADYARDQAPIVGVLMEKRLWSFVPAFTDDPEVRADVINHLTACGLPTGPAT